MGLNQVHFICGLEKKHVSKVLGGAPTPAELLEIADRLHEASILRVSYPLSGRKEGTDAASGDGHLASMAFFAAANQHLPQLELAVGDSVLARALTENHKPIADRFFPVDEEGALY